jgi:transposase InsO family protein
MPWTETRVSDERMKFIVEYEYEEESMAQLCRKYGISRKTGYKWLDRWFQDGPLGLEDRSRAPRCHPNKVPGSHVEAILSARDRWGWGPKKLRVLLSRDHPEIVWPAISTFEQILKDHARVIPRKKRRRIPPQTRPLAHCDGPNAVWCCDFKGHFATTDGQRCYPLTITDGFSRYLLRCQNLSRSDYTSVRPVFEWAFREYGLPRAIRSDNGPPFASRAVAGLSRLSVWWIKLGIQPERIEPGKPQQNGRHERMHLTLQQETASPPASTARKQQRRFDEFRRQYNDVRPHEALQMQTPVSAYEASPRPYPPRQPEVSYPDAWRVRKVQSTGEFYWKHQPVFLSEVLWGETIGLEPVDGRYWQTYFGPVRLGVFDSHRRQMLTGPQLRRQRELQPREPQDCPSATLQDNPEEK